MALTGLLILFLMFSGAGCMGAFFAAGKSKSSSADLDIRHDPSNNFIAACEVLHSNNISTVSYQPSITEWSDLHGGRASRSTPPVASGVEHDYCAAAC